MAEPLVWTDELVRKFWNYYSQSPHLYFTYQYGDRIVEKLAPHLKPGSEILDYGCGTGFLIGHLLNQPVQVYGTDVSNDSVESVNRKYSGTKNFKGAFLLNDLLQQKRKFDFIWVVEVIEHLTDEHMDALIGNVKNLLGEHGIAVFTTPNNEYMPDSTVYCPNCDHTFHRWQHVRSWSADSLSRYLNDRHLPVQQAYGLNFAEKPKTFRSRLRSMIGRSPAASAQPHLVAVCKASPVQ